MKARLERLERMEQLNRDELVAAVDSALRRLGSARIAALLVGAEWLEAMSDEQLEAAIAAAAAGELAEVAVYLQTEGA